MRLFAAILLAALTLANGCRPFKPSDDSTGPVRYPPRFLAAQRMKPGSAALEIAVVTISESRSAALESVWQAADFQSIDLKTRRLLDHNGFRSGVIGTRLPGELTRLLEWTEPLSSGPEIVGDPRSLHSFEGPVGFSFKQLEQLQPGTEHWIPCSPPRPLLTWTTEKDGQRKSGQCENATGGFTVGLISASDGNIRLWLRPEILHGQRRMRYGIDEDDFLFEPKQDRLTLGELQFTHRLLPGQTLIVAGNGVPEGLGNTLLTDGAGTSPGDQRILLIRPVKIQADDLFQTGNTQRRLSTSLD